jgi:excisionase family DNA binding protein
MAVAELTLTPPEVARKLRVSPDKVRAWIERGELAAFNVADRVGGRPRWRIEPEALAEFERRRTAIPRTRSPKKNRQADDVIEFF